MLRLRRAACGAALAALSALLSGCSTDGLAFRVDERLTFVTPEDRATVPLPVTLDWEIRDFEVTGPGGPVRDDAGYFAVFVDRTPMPPGEPLRWLARDDRDCLRDEACPDAEYLSARGVYTTEDTRLVLTDLARTGDDDERERHRATVVLLDAQSRRIGESAFEIAFEIERTTS